MFIEVETVTVPEPNLKEIIVETLLGDAYFFGCLFKGVLFCLSGSVAGAGIEFPPLDNLFDNVSDSPLFGSPALFFSFSKLGFLFFAGIFSLILGIGDCVLHIHESSDAKNR